MQCSETGALSELDEGNESRFERIGATPWHGEFNGVFVFSPHYKAHSEFLLYYSTNLYSSKISA
jgi:hypothetical protein